MAKTTVVGNAIVVTSTMKLADLKMIKKNRPEALTLMGGKENDVPQFIIIPQESGSCLNDNGVVFSDASRDGEELAQLTMVVSCEIEGDIKEWVVDNFGAALDKLAKLEATLPDVLAEIKADRERTLASISVAQ